MSHHHALLYVHKVIELADYSAGNVVLEFRTPCPSLCSERGVRTTSPGGKHARWWTKVFGSGAGEVNIVYHCGKENVSADTLSQ